MRGLEAAQPLGNALGVDERDEPDQPAALVEDLHAQQAPSERRRRFVADKLVPTLQPLVDRGPERVLPTHGEPILSDGAEELARALAREPFCHHG